MGPIIITISTTSLRHPPLHYPPSLHSLFLSLFSSLSIKNQLAINTIVFYLLFYIFHFTLHFLGVYVMEKSLGLLGGGGGGGAVVACELNGKVEKDYTVMTKEAELELGLGLSLGNGGGGGGAAEKGRSCAWGEYGRILTAKDFPNGFSSGRGGGAGTKRERVDEGSASAAVSNQVVGWPPIRSYRMNTVCNQAKTSNVVDDNEVGTNSHKKLNHGSEKGNEAIKERGHLGYVKVNMDGLPIGRKVDLNSHKSYETLAKALEEMFFKPPQGGGKEQELNNLPKLLDGSSEFVLTYEDKERDWMLVGDVPWGMFVSTVKRLRIMRTCEAKGLAPKSQEWNEKTKSKLAT